MISISGIQIMSFQIFATVFGVGMLVFIHELGHFIMAKKFKIRVEKFAFGFGPEIIGYTYGETRYSICAIPLGGMVKMPGEDIDSTTGSPDEFFSQAWYKRLLIAFFGPLMNYILAVFLFVCVLFFWGLAKPSADPMIGDLVAGYPAETSGLLAGDRVLDIDKSIVNTWNEMAEYIHKNPGKKVVMNILRGEDELLIEVEVKNDKESGLGLIGITPQMVTEKIGIVQSFELSCKMVVFQSVYTLKYLGQKIVRWEKPEVAGPIGVVQILAKAAKTGWMNLIHLLAVISVALGLFNLLPIPILDGGHIFLALFEGITRRPVNKKTVQVSNFIGLALILTIFVFATYSDLERLGLFGWFKNIIF